MPVSEWSCLSFRTGPFFQAIGRWNKRDCFRTTSAGLSFIRKHTVKILVANNYFYLRGGCERVMFNDMRSLAERGIGVVPFSAIDPANAPNDYAGFFARGV